MASEKVVVVVGGAALGVGCVRAMANVLVAVLVAAAVARVVLSVVVVALCFFFPHQERVRPFSQAWHACPQHAEH
eukprot:4098081-Lingulodinium_polyedra.AAC.1